MSKPAKADSCKHKGCKHYVVGFLCPATKRFLWSEHDRVAHAPRLTLVQLPSPIQHPGKEGPS